MEKLLDIKKIPCVQKSPSEHKFNYASIDELEDEPVQRSPRLMQIVMISIIVITILWVWVLIILIKRLFF